MHACCLLCLCLNHQWCSNVESIVGALLVHLMHGHQAMMHARTQQTCKDADSALWQLSGACRQRLH